MATFTITLPNTNIDSLAGKTGGDTYNINGGTLVIDQDTRYGLNQSSTASPATIAVSTSLGGTVDIDARSVRWIPYDTGSGNVPAGGTVITQGGASGKLICVASAINVTPTAAGAAMPASGFIKVKQVTGAFAAGALTGIGASATGADVVAPISLVGDESGTFSVPRLGQALIRGAWYEVGTTSGVNTTDYQLPTQGELLWLAGVQIETSAGSGVYEWWPSVGTHPAAAGNFGSEPERGQLCWISTAGVLRLGRDLSGNTTAHTPTAGRKIRIPNILTANCTAAARGTNAAPNTSMAIRFEFATTAAGALVFDKCSMAWYVNATQAYSLSMTDSAVCDAMLVQEVATRPQLIRVCVAPSAATSYNTIEVAFQNAGADIEDCITVRTTASGSGVVRLNGVYGVSIRRTTARYLVARGSSTCIAFVVNFAYDTLVEDCKQINGVTTANIGARLTVKNLSHIDVVSGSTGTGFAINAVNVTNAFSDVVVDGVNFAGLANVHPYIPLVNAGIASKLTVRNIGTRAAPLDLGSANACAGVVGQGTGTQNRSIRIQRCYVSNTRTALFSFDNAVDTVTIENCAGDYADAPTIVAQKMLIRGLASTVSLAAQNAVYGSIWGDCFTSTTAGRLFIAMNEPTTTEATQVTLENGAAYTAAGGLYMPTIGMRATFEMPYFMLGHTGFQNAAAVMAGGTIGNYTLEFQANTGAGFGAWTALTGANLAAVGAFPSTGIKMRVRITTSTTNTTAITSLYLLTTSTTTAQETQLYPLDTNTVTFTGLPTGTDVVVLAAGTDTILAQQDSHPLSSYSFVFSGAQNIDVGFIKPGFVPFYIRNLALTTTDSSIPVTLTADRNYS